MPRAFVGRQPVFDRKGEVFGYELLFRDGTQNRAVFSDPNHATSNVILNAFLEIGIERIAKDKPVFVNFTREFLLGDHPWPELKHKLHIEILEDVRVDGAVVDAVRKLREQGYLIALDDFVYREELIPLLECAHVVKLDLLALKREGILEQLAHLGRYKLDLVAEKVDNPDDHAFCMDRGFQYFQGYFLQKPEVVEGTASPTDRVALMQLLSVLHDKRTQLPEIVDLVERDVALTYRMLRCVNSPLYGISRKVSHVKQAVTLLGLTQVKQWVSLLLLSGSSHKPSSLVSTALMRAKMCECLGRSLGHPAPDALFTVGLFSLIDALLDMPLEEVLKRVPLTEEIATALRGQNNRAGEILNLVKLHEDGAFQDPRILSLEPGLLTEAWITAIEWAREAELVARGRESRP